MNLKHLFLSFLFIIGFSITSPYSAKSLAIVTYPQAGQTELNKDVSLEANLKQNLGGKWSLRKKFLSFFAGNKLSIKSVDSSEAKIDGFALTSMITGIVGLFIAGIPLGIISIVFSIVGLSRINRQPERRKGRGFAIAGLVLGIVGLVGAIIVLARMN